MKRSLILVMVLTLSLFGFLNTPSYADVSFAEDFEAGSGSWITDNGVWEIGTPTSGPASCYEGTQCAGTELNGNYGPETDSRLITPTMILPTIVGLEEVHLRFQNWFSYNLSDSGQVQISVWDSVTMTWGAWINEGTAIVNTSGWSLKDVDLTDYAGLEVRISFYHTAVDYGGALYGTDVSTGWYIDDIQIIAKVPEFTGDFETGWDDWSADRGVWQVGTPIAGPAGCFEGLECVGTELNGNYGPETDSRLITPTMVLPTIVGLEEVHLRFQNWFSYNLSDFGQVQISVWNPVTMTWGAWINEGTAIVNTSGWLLKDVDLTDYAGLEVRISFYHTAVDYGGALYGTDVSTGWYIDDIQIIAKVPGFTGDFETGWDDWGADNGVWQVGTPTAGPASCYEGTQCAGTELNGNYGPETDSRLIAPTMVLPTVVGLEEVHLRFQNWFSYNLSDSGQVQISVWNPVTMTWGAWANEGTAIVKTSGWSLKDVDLTTYAGKKVRISFYHTAVNYGGALYGTDVSTGWYIDDIQILAKVPGFTGDFETGWDDWNADRGVWQVGTPTAGPASCYEGTQCAGTELNGNYGPETDSRLITPTMVLPTVVGFEEVHLSFQNWFSYNLSDSGQVQVSVWNPVTMTWDAWTNEGTAIVNTSGWLLKDVDLTAYAGQKIRISFYHTAVDYGGALYGTDVSTGWYLDNIQICINGTCIHDYDFCEIIDCDDGDLCTTDSCIVGTGCNNIPVICSSGEQCDSGDGICEACNMDPVMLGMQYPYDSIQSAYDDITVGGTEIIDIQSMELGEGLIMDQEVTVTLKGGYDCFFNEPPTGQTIISASGFPALTISSGTVIIKNIILR